MRVEGDNADDLEKMVGFDLYTDELIQCYWYSVIATIEHLNDKQGLRGQFCLPREEQQP